MLRLFTGLSFALVTVLAATAIAAPPAAAPTRAALVKRANALGLGAHADAIARDALPGALLLPGGRATLGGTRLGGSPDLPRGTAWPRCKGRPLSFLAQLRLADLRAIAPGAVGSDATLLAVFADLREDRSGIPPIEEAHGRVGEATCVMVRAARGSLTRRRSPAGVRTLRRRPVRLRRTLTIPDYQTAEGRYDLRGDRKALDRYDGLFQEAAEGALGRKPGFLPHHQVLGWASPIQDAPVFGCGRGRLPTQPTYRLLLQLDFDDSLRFAIGDGGALYLTGRPADLRVGRFGRLCAEFQEG